MRFENLALFVIATIFSQGCSKKPEDLVAKLTLIRAQTEGLGDREFQWIDQLSRSISGKLISPEDYKVCNEFLDSYFKPRSLSEAEFAETVREEFPRIRSIPFSAAERGRIANLIDLLGRTNMFAIALRVSMTGDVLDG